MKYLCILALAMSILACNEESPNPVLSDVPLTVLDYKTPEFLFIPKENLSLEIVQQDIAFKEAIVLSDKDTMHIAPFSERNGSGIDRVDFNFNFEPGRSYNIVVNSERNNDTIYQHTIKNYIQPEVNKLIFTKLFDIIQGCKVDLSPSNKTLYVCDYLGGSQETYCILKKWDIEKQELKEYPGNEMLYFEKAFSDNEIILDTAYITGTHQDTCKLIMFNLDTNEQRFLGWASSSYGRISRVINNHILFNNPVRTNHILDINSTTTLLNIDDLSKKIFTYEEFDYRYLYTDNFNYLFYKNQTYDFQQEAFTPNMKLPEYTYFVSIDKDKEYKIANYALYRDDLREERVLVYKNEEVIYESETLTNGTYNFSDNIQLKDNKLIVYKHFDYSNTINFSGYYLIDLNTKTETLLALDHSYKQDITAANPFEIYSIRYNDGVYKLSYNN